MCVSQLKAEELLKFWKQCEGGTKVRACPSASVMALRTSQHVVPQHGAPRAAVQAQDIRVGLEKCGTFSHVDGAAAAPCLPHVATPPCHVAPNCNVAAAGSHHVASARCSATVRSRV